MKKSIFVSLGILSLLVVGGASFALSANRQEFKEAKADPVEYTVNPTGNFADNGNKNVIDLECTPENDIPKGWDAGALVQTSRDAVIINGQYLQDQGGNITMRKQGTYRYTICIDSVYKFHDIIQDDDIVIVGGQWAQGEDIVVSLTPLCVQWTGTNWVKLDSYDIGSVTLSIKDSRKNNVNELYFAATPENIMPANTDWSIRAKQGSDDGFIFNGVETKPVTGHKVELMKLRQDLYLVYIPDTGSPYNSVVAGDVITIQGIYVYQYSPRFVMHLHIPTFSVTWDGTQWVDYVPPALVDSSADQLEAGSLLANIGRTDPNNHSKTSVKNFDQRVYWDNDLGEEVDTLVYKKDTNNHTGVYFTSSSGADGEFRVYFPGNGYKTESKGYAMTQLTFDYIYDNSNTIGENSRNPSITSDGYFVDVAEHVSNNFTVQALLNKNAKNMYYDIEVDLVNDGQLHSVTINLAYGSVLGFGFKVWDFNGMFFMSNVHANYQTYNADLDNMYGLLKMYDSYNDPNYTDCTDYYAAAKAGYLALDADEKALFGTNAAYASAKARLVAWADANGDVFDAAAGTITAKANMRLFNGVNNQNSIAIIIAIVMSSSVVLLGVLLVLKKKHKYN